MAGLFWVGALAGLAANGDAGQFWRYVVIGWLIAALLGLVIEWVGDVRAERRALDAWRRDQGE